MQPRNANALRGCMAGEKAVDLIGKGWGDLGVA
jgi:hypothetical protein